MLFSLTHVVNVCTATCAIDHSHAINALRLRSLGNLSVLQRQLLLRENRFDVLASSILARLLYFKQCDRQAMSMNENAHYRSHNVPSYRTARPSKTNSHVNNCVFGLSSRTLASPPFCAKDASQANHNPPPLPQIFGHLQTFYWCVFTSEPNPSCAQPLAPMSWWSAKGRGFMNCSVGWLLNLIHIKLSSDLQKLLFVLQLQDMKFCIALTA